MCFIPTTEEEETIRTSVSFIVGIIGLVEGIIYLTKSDEEFVRVYGVERKAWF